MSQPSPIYRVSSVLRFMTHQALIVSEGDGEFGGIIDFDRKFIAEEKRSSENEKE